MSSFYEEIANRNIKEIKEGSRYLCWDCNKIHYGQGYLVDGKGNCLKHFQQKFPKFTGGEK